MTPDTMQDLINWLCRHEDDIKIGINDFDDLQQVFIEVVGRRAGDVTVVEPTFGEKQCGKLFARSLDISGTGISQTMKGR